MASASSTAQPPVGVVVPSELLARPPPASVTTDYLGTMKADTEGRLQCGCSTKGRNLIVCIDGTTNEFGKHNTNVVELYSKLVKNDQQQLTYYNSGIGTYPLPKSGPRGGSESSLGDNLRHYFQKVLPKLRAVRDSIFAENVFEKNILAAYRWLSDNYRENDRIYFFGFSRGAYQVRTLAGMIETVGLIHKGNEEQIPFAYASYVALRKRAGKHEVPEGVRENSADVSSGSQDIEDKDDNTNMCAIFKSTFSHKNAHVHFVGVWDTVSAMGFTFREPGFFLTDSSDHICFFRHALALDERRVKFLPEYVHGGTSIQEPRVAEADPRVKEVWFPGTHSDIGGGHQENQKLDLGAVPLLWMAYEALSHGVLLLPTGVDWRWDDLGTHHESMTWFYWIAEWWPFERLTYNDASSMTWRLHRGRGRKVQPGQKIHVSTAFYSPDHHIRARLPRFKNQPGPIQWADIVGKGKDFAENPVPAWESILEKDIFEISSIIEVIKKLKSLSPESRRREEDLWAYRLARATIIRKRLALEDPAELRGAGHDLSDILKSGIGEHTRTCVIDLLKKLIESLKDNGGDHYTFNREECGQLLGIVTRNSGISRRPQDLAMILLTLTLCPDSPQTDNDFRQGIENILTLKYRSEAITLSTLMRSIALLELILIYDLRWCELLREDLSKIHVKEGDFSWESEANFVMRETLTMIQFVSPRMFEHLKNEFDRRRQTFAPSTATLEEDPEATTSRGPVNNTVITTQSVEGDSWNLTYNYHLHQPKNVFMPGPGVGGSGNPHVS